jgi:hypothetical protein
MNLLRDNINTIKKTEHLTDANKEIGLEVNAEETKYEYMLLPCHRNARKNHDIKVTN